MGINFIKTQISQGRYNNASEVIRVALRLLEENEKQITVLKTAINKGLECGFVENFAPHKHLKAARANG